MCQHHSSLPCTKSCTCMKPYFDGKLVQALVQWKAMTCQVCFSTYNFLLGLGRCMVQFQCLFGLLKKSQYKKLSLKDQYSCLLTLTKHTWQGRAMCYPWRLMSLAPPCGAHLQSHTSGTGTPSRECVRVWGKKVMKLSFRRDLRNFESGQLCYENTIYVWMWNMMWLVAPWRQSIEDECCIYGSAHACRRPLIQSMMLLTLSHNESYSQW